MQIEHNLKVTPCLWFNFNAEEAVSYYISLFGNSKIVSVTRYPEGGGVSSGTALFVTFQLAGVEFYALNAGPQYPHTDAFSLFVHCKTQDEVDDLWNKLSEGGSEGRCGWLKDKFGLSWQIVPDALGKLMQDKDPKKAGNVVQAMMKMNKIIIKDLEVAYAI